MNTVAQLVEEGHNLVVLEQTGLLRARLGEVAHQGGGGEASVTLCINETLRESTVSSLLL